METILLCGALTVPNFTAKNVLILTFVGTVANLSATIVMHWKKNVKVEVVREIYARIVW